jgi:hypothetical protein
MDRYGIWLGNCPNKDLISKVELVEIADIEDEKYVLDLYLDLLQKGYTKFDLLAINEVKNQDNWKFLGFDVGEKSNDENKWSAIYKYDHYSSYEKIKPWIDKLNANGLFTSKKEASKFRDFYLKSEDPVLKQASQNENKALYQVAGVYLCTKFDHLVYSLLLKNLAAQNGYFDNKKNKLLSENIRNFL